MQPSVHIQNLGKQFSLHAAPPYLSLREALRFGRSGSKEKFWALQDINLNIMPGERLGIIGHNGAGKSTLLKIISRITPPTTGKAIIRGRVGSLLEVGTGFHPELSGRENIFLNGSILGLKRKEISQQLDSIIDFSGTEKFIDTPLKHFSSGMQLRLAFAVAAHLEPEVLLIDEVLAVGDLAFQRKCISKMEEVSQTAGRTILFVSHNLSQVKQLCNKAILLDSGRMVFEGTAAETVNKYSEAFFSGSESMYKNADEKAPNKITAIALYKNGQPVSGMVQPGDDVYLQLTIMATSAVSNSLIAIRFTNQENIPVFTTTNGDAALQYPVINAGQTNYKIKLPVDLLTPGRYSITVSWSEPRRQAFDLVVNKLFLHIENEQYAGSVLNDDRLGTFSKNIDWEKI